MFLIPGKWPGKNDWNNGTAREKVVKLWRGKKWEPCSHEILIYRVCINYWQIPKREKQCSIVSLSYMYMNCVDQRMSTYRKAWYVMKCSKRILVYYSVPTRTGKLGKWEGIFQSAQKSGNFEQTGKVLENHTKYWKSQENFRQMLFIIFSAI